MLPIFLFQTDPENVDYELESGATRNFEAAKTLAEMEKKKQAEIEAEEAANPMKVCVTFSDHLSCRISDFLVVLKMLNIHPFW